MEAVRGETKKMDARAKESVMEAVRAEKEILFKQFSQLIPNFDPNLLGKTPITPIPPIPQEQSPKNPMSDKASYSNVRALVLEEDNPTNDADADVDATENPPHMLEEVFGTDHDTWLSSENILQFASMVEIRSTVIALYMRYLFDYLKKANMVNLVGLMDPGQVNSQSRTLSHRSKYLLDCLKNADGDQFYLVPYNPGGHWVLIIVRPAKETVYYMDSLPNRYVDEDMRNIVNTQPTNVECGYYVMRFMRDIIHDAGLAFEKKFDKKKEPVVYTQEYIDEVRLEWAEFVNKQLQNNK
ncbi:hypothetical protein L3X38_004426 [Prunus dulcis]|uniref:Ubiquitin-like protease family profile domain-containing protein n=1 Tax=Prunus dulcis TaxID=3755 RepID=A0AAD4ZNV4_PRUDU|nr:hypothetical protein L3X38_004426 [Prunus dulcis]